MKIAVFPLFFLLVVTVHCQDEVCPKNMCIRPDCVCISQEKLFPRKEDTPQFVMLTFDDAVTIANIGTYRDLLEKRENKRTKCPIAATFFVSHEYADYQLVNELWRKGCEIAVHTISHLSDIDYWKNGNSSRWKDEIAGMRSIISRFAKIPQTDILGFRAAFLQTAGDVTFKTLLDNSFLWDSSMPTLAMSMNPVYPYTLDYGYLQDCQIQPCPWNEYKGLWEVPLVMWHREVDSGSTHCSMVDACTPYPVTQKDTFDFFSENFMRHYNNNRAPFPVFLHEAWLKNEERRKGYFQFLDWILQKDDVFVVTVKEVLDYLRDPQPLSSYKQSNCQKTPKPDNCAKSVTCNYQVNRNGDIVPRIMRPCLFRCPPNYPWVGNPSGL